MQKDKENTDRGARKPYVRSYPEPNPPPEIPHPSHTPRQNGAPEGGIADDTNRIGRAGRAGKAGKASGHAFRAQPSKPLQSSPAAPATLSSFAARFGTAILRDGVASIPSALFYYQGRLQLTAQQAWFISWVLAQKWDEHLPHPSVQEIARCSGVSERTLRYRCEELRDLGYLETFPRCNSNGGQAANYFDFGGLFARLEELMVTEGSRSPLYRPNPIEEGQADEEVDGRDENMRIMSGHAPGNEYEPGYDAQRDFSFAARFGRVILSAGVAAVPRALFTHQGTLSLTPQQVWFACYILSFQWHESLPHPSINKMAERTGYSKRHLLDVKAELEKMGYLVVLHRTGQRGEKTNNAYDFTPLFDAISARLQVAGSSGQFKAQYSAPITPIVPAVPTTPDTSESGGAARFTRAGARKLTSPVQSGSPEGVQRDSPGGVQSGSPAGVQPGSPAGVQGASPGTVQLSSPQQEESSQQESFQEEQHQQQADQEFSDEQWDAYDALVAVGIFQSEAKKLVSQFEADHIQGWVDHYLKRLRNLDNLANPVGVLVKSIRSGEEPPLMPSRAELDNMSRQRSWGF